MKETLKEQLFSIAREYARQFGELIEYCPEFWVADEPWLCCFGNCYFFTLEEMVCVVDNLDKYVKRYGSKDAVAQEVRDWVDWCFDGINHDFHIPEAILPRVVHHLRPNISLVSWLSGCHKKV